MKPDTRPLLNLLSDRLTKADKDLRTTMTNAGFLDVDAAVDMYEDLTDLEDEDLEDYVSALIDEIRAQDTVEDVQELLDGDSGAGKLSASLSETISDKLLQGLMGTLNAYLTDGNKNLTADSVSEQTVDAVYNLAETYAKSMADHVVDQLSGFASVAYQREETPETLADTLSDATSVNLVMHSATYAWSAVLALHSFAAHEAIMQNPACTGRMWKHTTSPRVVPRKHHKALDGTVVDKTAPFKLAPSDGLVYECMYPRELTLPPSETINCHCIEVAVIDDDILNSDIDGQVEAQYAAIEAMNEAFEDAGDTAAVTRAKKWITDNT